MSLIFKLPKQSYQKKRKEKHFLCDKLIQNQQISVTITSKIKQFIKKLNHKIHLQIQLLGVWANRIQAQPLN